MQKERRPTRWLLDYPAVHDAFGYALDDLQDYFRSSLGSSFPHRHS